MGRSTAGNETSSKRIVISVPALGRHCYGWCMKDIEIRIYTV